MEQDQRHAFRGTHLQAGKAGALASMGMPLLVALAACGGHTTTIEAGGVRYPVSSREADIARWADSHAPDGHANEACKYWSRQEREIADGTHKVRAAVLEWDAHSSPELRQWAAARKDAACSSIDEQTQCPTPPSPARRYTTQDARAYLSNDAVADPEQFDAPYARTLPPNSAVDVVAFVRNPGRSDEGCEYAAVTIVDAGGAARSGERYILSIQSLAESSRGPSPGEVVRKRREDAQAAARAAIEKEMESGRCNDEHADELHRATRALDQLVQGLSGDGTVYLLTDHKLLVATPKGELYSLQPGLSGEYHVLAVGYAKDLSVVAADEQGYAVNDESRLGPAAGSMLGLATSSRVLHATGRVPLRVSVSGHGCTLLAVVHKEP